ncbi:ornithine cyclodeaminase family protein [Enterococcus faecalis]|uniref:ornithine cyclodeaminase family protein n=1 Tax=Enterococcus faecalis TaxID=1351 RepID=UPI0028926E23|nr:ornithine cyclodeaminase family protein [Enterococcus faecalis]EHB6449886.1 ornithine cyclodeaminase family protein [Enterococcus faecalis]MDT2103205.1 ornithine cyclodeaminase family protein [Enterococcus faecalis]
MDIISYERVIQQLSFSEAIQVMKRCFAELQKGKISQSERHVEVLPDGENQNLFALMPAYLGKNRFFGAKIITAFPENPQKNLASHLGQILLFDSSTGRPVAMMDANAITWLRTAAVSALATDYLAAPKAKSIALIGAGQQASSHLAALQSVRAIEKVFIYDRTAERARKLIAKQQHNYPASTFIGCSSVQEAVQEAEIICTLTSSQDAFLEEKDVLPNAHINAIGTFTPTSRELTSDLVKNSQVFVDEYAAALKESGDLLIPISEGAFSAEKIVGSLGELVTGKVKLKAEQKGRTIFDAVGLAVEDLCCAEYIYQKIQGEN